MADADATRALLKARWQYADDYAGTAEQLCACGLVQPGQFPGQPGRGKVRATYFVSDGEPAPQGCSGFEPTYIVQRSSVTRFTVSVAVTDQERQRRKTIPGDKHGRLPMDLPATPETVAPAAPTWTPAGFVFRRKREADYVFEASADSLRKSGVMGAQPLPHIDDEKRNTVRVRSLRFGWGVVAKRTAGTFFVALNSPREVRNADYEVSDSGWAVYHKGTKQQLLARGLGVGFGFPGEPGCNSRKVTVPAPPAGSELHIELLHPSDWFGEVPRFAACERRSETEQEAQRQAKRDADAEKARLERLKTMPATPDEYRDEVAQSFWFLANMTKAHMQSKDGYRFTSEAVDDFLASVTEAYWTIKNGATEGSSPRRKFQQVVGANAKADQPLQRFLAGLRPDGAH